MTMCSRLLDASVLRVLLLASPSAIKCKTLQCSPPVANSAFPNMDIP